MDQTIQRKKTTKQKEEKKFYLNLQLLKNLKIKLWKQEIKKTKTFHLSKRRNRLTSLTNFFSKIMVKYNPRPQLPHSIQTSQAIWHTTLITAQFCSCMNKCYFLHWNFLSVARSLLTLTLSLRPKNQPALWDKFQSKSDIASQN